MLTFPGKPRLFIYQGITDMRKSFEGLSAIAEHSFPNELLTGAYFIFLNRRGDCMKVLYWDTDGLAIWYKRLEKGRFSRKKSQEPSISRRDFLMLLEGVEPKKINCRHNIP